MCELELNTDNEQGLDLFLFGRVRVRNVVLVVRNWYVIQVLHCTRD